MFGLNVWVGSQIGMGREDHFQGSEKKVVAGHIFLGVCYKQEAGR